MKWNAVIGLVLSMIIITTPFSAAIFDWEQEAKEEATGESILVNVKGYEPAILPAGVIEDGDVPVYVFLTGTSPGSIIGSSSTAEPLYGTGVKIKRFYTRPLDEETMSYVRGNPNVVEPREYSMDNLGYLIITLKQIEKEADVPDEINLNMKAEITFENADRLYSMIEQDLVIPEDRDESAWRSKPLDEYKFFSGRGAVRASEITEDSAKLTVYGGQDLQWPFTGTPRPLEDIELAKGETSDPIRLSTATDLMTNAFRVKLSDIIEPSQHRARIRVNVNGEEREYVVTEGSKLYPGSELVVQEINTIRQGKKITYELVIRGPRDQTKVSKSFIERAGETIASAVGLVSDSAAGAIRGATQDERQAGTAEATTGAFQYEVNYPALEGTCDGGKSCCGKTALLETDGEVAAAQERESAVSTEALVTAAPRDDTPCAAMGGTCADTRVNACMSVSGLGRTEISFTAGKCLSNPASWWKCCKGTAQSIICDAGSGAMCSASCDDASKEAVSANNDVCSELNSKNICCKTKTCGPNDAYSCLTSCTAPSYSSQGRYDSECGLLSKCCRPEKCAGNTYDCRDSCGPEEIELPLFNIECGNRKCCAREKTCDSGKGICRSVCSYTFPIPDFEHESECTITSSSGESRFSCCEPAETCGSSAHGGNVCVEGSCPGGYTEVAENNVVCGPGKKCCTPPGNCGPEDMGSCKAGSCGAGYSALTRYDSECGAGNKCCQKESCTAYGFEGNCAAECGTDALLPATECGASQQCCITPAAGAQVSITQTSRQGAFECGSASGGAYNGNKFCYPEGLRDRMVSTLKLQEQNKCGPDDAWQCKTACNTGAGETYMLQQSAQCVPMDVTALGGFVPTFCCKPKEPEPVAAAAEVTQAVPAQQAAAPAQKTCSQAGGACRTSCTEIRTASSICEGKEIILRESDSPEQWLATIKSATQEMVYCTAAKEYERLAQQYFGIEDSQGILYEDKAYFKLGNIYYWLGDSEKALEYYKKSIRNNKGSFIPEARARIDELEADALDHARFTIGEFEENGAAVRVKLMNILWQDQASRPTATLQVEQEGTKSIPAGKSIFANDFVETGPDGVARNYNWNVKSMSADSVVIEKTYRATPPEAYRTTRVLSIRESITLDGHTVMLKSVDLKKYAIVTIIPGTGAPLVSETNFTVHIPIEKRLISLTPDEIGSQINDTQEIIKDLDDVINELTDVVTVWKKVCLGTFLFLTIKNSFFMGLSRTQARQFAMHGIDGRSGWDAYCRANSGDDRQYGSYDKCIAENSASIDTTIDASQKAVEKANDDMENYRGQAWYRQLASNYSNISKYGDYIGEDLFDEQQLRDYRYWQLMRQSSAYTQLNGGSDETGYDLRREVDRNLGSFNLENSGRTTAYNEAVGAIQATYPDFDKLPEDEKRQVFSDLYQSSLANPDTNSNDFPLIESIGLVPLATVRRENNEFYSNTPIGRVGLAEATVENYVARLTLENATAAASNDAERQKEIAAELERVRVVYQENPAAPLSTNQGQVFVDGSNNFFVAMTAAYATGQTNDNYAQSATAEFYPDGKPYCIPTTNGNYVKVLDFYMDGSPSVIQEWNVGTDGLLCTADDVLVRHQSMLERSDSESIQRSLIETASRVGTRSEGQMISASGRQFAVSTSRAQSDNSRSQPNCYDTMDPDDCRLLFGVCDPVMCPASRFNLGGTWQVNDVVQTGLIGSMVLGLPNFDIPYEPVPICLTGVLAGLQNIKSVLRGYVECLKTAQISGQSVGICDKIRSVFICELLWKEAIAIFNIRGGIFNWISQTFFGQQEGGGEYMTFESSLQNVADSVSFFTTQYAQTAFASYQSRSMEEIGTTVCKQAIFGKVPALGEFFDQLAQPESPPQYTALLTETSFSETTGTSRYEVFYHIYAGEDNEATYSVFLKNSVTGESPRYVTERCEGRQGHIDKGGIASYNIDCIAPKGFDQVCITLNGNTECGFGKVTTSFGLNYLNDLIVSDEAQRQINSEEECVPSAPTTSPSLGSLPMPSSGGILSSGIQRVCSAQNPGQGTNSLDWKEVGTCGKDSSGRSLGKCWIDMTTVSIRDTERMEEVSRALDEAGFREQKEELGITGLLDYNASMSDLNRINALEKTECGQITEAMALYHILELRTITPAVAAESQYMYSTLMETSAEKCAKYDLRREIRMLKEQLEYELEGVHADFSIRLQDEIIPTFRGSEITPATLPDFFREFRAELNKTYSIAKTNLTALKGMDSPAAQAKYGTVLDPIYLRYYNLEVPFEAEGFEGQASEDATDSRVVELRCQRCGDGTTNQCDREECGALSSSCFFTEGALSGIWSSEDVANECHACAIAAKCSDYNDDPDKCQSQQCTSKAGLNCEWRSGTCQASMEQRPSAGAGATQAVANPTSSSGTKVTPVTGMSIGYDNPGARTTGNVVNYGYYVDFDPGSIPGTADNVIKTRIMKQIVLKDTPSNTPEGVSTFAEGAVAATVYYTADCKDKPGWADGTKWYTGLWNNAETILATNPKECTSNTDCTGADLCKVVGSNKYCKTKCTALGEKKACWWETPCKMPLADRGYYEEIKCEGSGACENLIYSAEGIGIRKGEGGTPKTPANEHGYTKTGVKPDVHRTIAVNPNDGSQCFIPYGSLLYIKFNDGNPLNGWYYAEDTGGGFHERCKIDMYGGVGESEMGVFRDSNNKQSRKWQPEIWVYPPRDTEGAASQAATQSAEAAEATGCRGCGGSGTWGGLFNSCDSAECHGIGPCYYKEGAAGVPGTDYQVRTFVDSCYTCASTERCSDFNNDEAMCKAVACTARAGLYCEWKDGACAERTDAPAAATPGADAQSPASMCTSNTRCASCSGVTYTSAKKVGVIGDSITNGTNSYACYLNRQCNTEFDFYNYGVNGETTSRIKSRFQADIISHRFDEVIIMGGINNGNNANAVEADLQDMYTMAKQAGMRVIALTITPYKGYREWTPPLQNRNDAVNSWIMDTVNGAKDVDIRADVYSALEDPANPDAMKDEYANPDKLHPNRAGQEAIGTAVFDAAYAGCSR